jgi:TolA-binding protein
MKKLLSITSALLFVGVAGIAFSQTVNSTPAISTTFAATDVKGKDGPPLLNEICGKIARQSEGISTGVRNQELTRDQARALRKKLMTLREELQNDLKTTGNKELADDQFQQLKQELNDNSAAIKSAKTSGDSDTAPAAQ